MQTNMDVKKDKIIEIISNNVEELEGVDITGNLTLITSGYIDSFDIINIIGLLENEFSIEIDLDNIELEEFNTVDSICKLINNAGTKKEVN